MNNDNCENRNQRDTQCFLRCRCFEEFCWAVKNIHNINPENCRNWAVSNYSCERVADMYEEYFGRISRLFNRGWYSENDGRTELDWLKRYYPTV